MSEIRKNLGGVTAYAYAKTKGYTGTEEEFAQLMANYATVGQAAEEAAEQAISAEINAESAAQTATTKASEASSSATSASSSASAAATSETNAAASATSASGSATQAATSASAAQAAQAAAEEVAESIPEDYTDLSNNVDNITATVAPAQTVEGDLGILVPYNSMPKAAVLSVGSDITGIKSTGKNLYPYTNIPRYDYGFYVSSLADAKARGIRLPKGVYTLAYTSSLSSSRLCIRAWTDNGTLLTDATKFKAMYTRNTGTDKTLFWQTYRFTLAMGSVSPILSIEVYNDGVWLLFCEDNGSSYGDVTNVMMTQGWDDPATYEAYSAESYAADVSEISVVPDGMIVFSASGTADIDTSVRFNLISNASAKMIANPFDTSESGYAIGDYCIYNNRLWRCTAAQAQGSYFDVNSWVEICIMDEITALKADTRALNLNTRNPFMMGFMQSTTPKVFAHAGYKSADAPENTIPAFVAAGEYGFFGIETDVQQTADGHFVILHDTTLDRTTNGTGNVNEKTLAEIRALHIKDHDDLQVPTLEEFLGICKMYGCVPQPEIKSTVTDVDGMIAVIESFGFADKCIYSGSPYTNIGNFKAKTKMPFFTIYQTGSFPDIEQIVNNLMDVYGLVNMGVAVEGVSTLSKATIERCHANNIFTLCFVLDDKATVQQAFLKGYDFVTTNTVHLP